MWGVLVAKEEVKPVKEVLQEEVIEK